MSTGGVERGSEAWQHLKEILGEVHGGKVYRRRKIAQGGRGGGRDGGIGGDKGGRGGGALGVVIG